MEALALRLGDRLVDAFLLWWLKEVTGWKWYEFR